MKYTIEGYSQLAMLQYGLTAKDVSFLRWFVDWQAMGTMKFRDDKYGNRYFWLEHTSVLESLPAVMGLTAEDYNVLLDYLKAKEMAKAAGEKLERPLELENHYRNLRRYIRSLGTYEVKGESKGKGILTSLVHKRGKDRGTETYIRIDPKVLHTLTQETTRGQKCPVNQRTKMSCVTEDKNDLWDSSITYSSNNNNSNRTAVAVLPIEKSRYKDKSSQKIIAERLRLIVNRILDEGPLYSNNQAAMDGLVAIDYSLGSDMADDFVEYLAHAMRDQGCCGGTLAEYLSNYEWLNDELKGFFDNTHLPAFRDERLTPPATPPDLELEAEEIPRTELDFQKLREAVGLKAV